jgi:DNA replication ATP-dependent helicase Dna2
MRDCPLVEMHTADKFQGRDKEVVILSLVRSNEQKNVGDLLKDWRRINVSLTRARTKLLVIGSRETLKGNELLGSFLQLMEEKGWDFEIPKGALEMHHFEEGGTPSQVTASARSVGGAGNAAVAPAIPRVLTEKSRENVSPAKVKRVEKGKVVKTVVPGKTGKIGERAILKNRPVLRDILNDMM